MYTHYKKVVKHIKDYYELYILVLPAVIIILLFNYIPMYGVQIAFREFDPSKGFVGGEFVGLKYFTKFINSFQFTDLIKNTFFLSFYSILAGFPVPIILALFINQIKKAKAKKFIQTVSYMPHFISVIVLVGMLSIFLSPSSGIVGHVYRSFGLDPINFMGATKYFRSIYVLSDIWQHSGWNSIIYIAALSAIDGFLMLFFTFTMFFNGGLIPTYLTVKNFHLDNTIWVMLIPFSVNVYNIIISRTFFQNNIPGELLEAAKLDGCSNIQFFVKVVLPLSKAILAVISLYYIVGYWKQDYSQFQAKSKDPDYQIVGSTMGWSLEDRFGPEYAKDYEVLLPLAAEKGIDPIWPAHPARTKYLNNVAQITTKNKNPETTIKWLDGFYTEEMSAQGYYGSLDLCLEKQGDKYIVLPPQDGMGADEWKWTNALVDAGLMYVSPELDKRIIAPESITQRVDHDALYEPYFPKSADMLPILKFSKDDMNEISIIKTDILKMVDIKWAQWIIEGNVDAAIGSSIRYVFRAPA